VGGLKVRPIRGTRPDVSRETMKPPSISIIAIDGPAGVGKTSVSRKVAEALGYYFFSSGLIYRVIAQRLLEQGWKTGDEPRMDDLKGLMISVGAEGKVFVDGVAVTNDLHTEAISTTASEVSARREIRALADNIQRTTVERIGQDGTFPGVVLEGRDIGTVVFPDANHKFFLTASETIRAQRRLAEREKLDGNEDAQTVQAAMRERDQRDSTRAVAPLVPAQDARVIDTGDHPLEGVVEIVLAGIKR